MVRASKPCPQEKAFVGQLIVFQPHGFVNISLLFVSVQKRLTTLKQSVKLVRKKVAVVLKQYFSHLRRNLQLPSSSI